MWSLGCLFGELLQTKPVFYCRSDQEVLDKAFKMLGTPYENSSRDCHVPFYLKLKKFKEFKFKMNPKPENLSQFFPYGTP